MKNIIQHASKALLALAILPLLAGCGTTGNGVIVKNGNEGIVVSHYNGTVSGNILHAGFHPQAPFSGNQLIEIPTHLETYTMVRNDAEGSHQGDDSVMVNTLSSNTLNVDASITYHILYEPQHPEKIIALYNKYRTLFTTDNWGTFEETQLRPAFRQAIVDGFGLKNTAYDMTGAGKREAAAYALQELNTKFAPDGIQIDEVRVRAIYPDAATVTTLRSRLQAQQNLKLSTLNLQLNQITNQTAVLKAQADAQAAHIRAASLTPRLVKFKHIKDLEIVGVAKGMIVSVPPATTSAAAPAATDDASDSKAAAN